jgi:hypothetical protein
MQIVLTGVQVLVSRTPEHVHWLAHFCWGLLIAAAEKGKAIEIILFRCSLIGSFYGVSYCDNRERVFMFGYDTKEKEHQNTRQSD